MIRIKRTVITPEAEKDIITAMITSDRFLRDIQPILLSDLFQIPYSKIISSWCTDHFTTYQKAPGKVIQDIFRNQAESKLIPESQVETISEFLSGLSKQFSEDETINDAYMLDKAEQYFKSRSLDRLKDNIASALSVGDIAKGEQAVSKYKRVQRPTSGGLDIFNREALIHAFNEEEDNIFCMPGALGKVLKPFSREDLYAITAPAKRGKTWWLQEIGIKSLMARLKVLFVTLEMSETQLVKRIYQNFLAESKYGKDDIMIPYFDEDNNIKYKKINKPGLTFKKANRKRKAMERMLKGGQMRIFSYPAYSANVNDIYALLDTLEHFDKFIPDVILVDYADILAPEKGGEYRHQIDHTWKALRGMAQQRKSLVVTASHSNKATLTRDVQQGDLSEDSRKLNHVAGMLSLNQLDEDKQNGIMRVKMMGLRHDHFAIDDEVIVLQNLFIGKPYIDSRLKKDVPSLKNSERR